MHERLLKRRGKRLDDGCRRRMGSWEYVPTSELVAKKTRFFDDLAEGRIDVRSDDLYSRVKCRRRQTGSDEEAEGPEAGEKENFERAGPSRLSPGIRGRRERRGRRRRTKELKEELKEETKEEAKAEVKVEVKEENAEEEESAKEKAEEEEEEEQASASSLLQREASSVS